MATKKQIVCPKCQAKLKFAPDKIISEVVKFKCPGCSTVLRIKKPSLQKEHTPSHAISQTEPKTESNIEQPGAECLGPGIEPEIKKDLGEADQADKVKEVEPAISEKIEEEQERKRKEEEARLKKLEEEKQQLEQERLRKESEEKLQLEQERLRKEADEKLRQEQERL